MDVETKIKADMRSLGCKSEAKVTLAYHLYMYLVDQKLMYDAEYFYNQDIDVLFVVARPSKNEGLSIFVPIPTSFDISVEYISKLQFHLCTPDIGPKVTLAFIEGDFTMVMYTFTKGLINRPSAEIVSEQRNRESRRTFINHELKKNHVNIVDTALNGGLIEDT